MSKNVGFKLDIHGLNELMKSPEMQSALDEAGKAVANSANDGAAVYGYRTHLGDFTALCNVYPDSEKAANENYHDNTLLKAVSAVGLPMSKKG